MEEPGRAELAARGPRSGGDGPPLPTDSLDDRRLTAWILALLTGGIAFQWILAQRLNINWDEFHYLADVYDLGRGTLEYGWATIHARLFGWLTGIGGDEVDQILLVRRLLVALGALTAFLIYRVARRLVGRSAALLAALTYVSFTFVLRNGASFRPDPFCALLLVLALDLLMPPRRVGWSVLAGVAVALAVLFSPKAWLFAILSAGVLVALSTGRELRWREAGVRGALFGVALGVAWFLGATLHGRDVVAPATEVSGGLAPVAAAERLLRTGSWFPQLGWFLRSVDENTTTWILIVSGIGVAVWSAVAGRGRRRWKAVVLLWLAAPLGALLVYRNAFPYFYVFLMPTVVLITGGLASALLSSSRGASPRLRRIAVAALAASCFVEGARYFASHRDDETVAQRQLVGVVHGLFPEPVGYVDRCSMISSFPKAGFFMSTWGLQRYRAARRPIFRELLSERPVGFLVVNSVTLQHAFSEGYRRQSYLTLLPEDVAVLRENFVHHWGPIFVRGKTIVFGGPPAEVRTFEILGRGRYTVETDGRVRLDDRVVGAGEVVELEEGTHLAEPVEGVRFLRLRWGDRLPWPSAPPSREPIFTNF